MKRKPTHKVEARYVGNITWWHDSRVWHKWHAYRDEKTAQMAMENLQRKFSGLYEFRVTPL